MKRLLCLLLCALLVCGAAGLAEEAAPGQYKELKSGMTDPDVGKLKYRLYVLGYYARSHQNDVYTDATAEIVSAFQAANGLKATGIATPETQELMYSEAALPKPTATPRATATPRPTAVPKSTAAPAAAASPSPAATQALAAETTPYAELVQPLTIGEYAYLSRVDGQLQFDPQVQNLSAGKDALAFELVFYARDAAGVPIRLAEGPYIRRTFEKTVPAGETQYAGATDLAGFEEARQVFTAVSSVTLSDGATIDLPEEEWTFFSWTVE